MEVRKVDIFSGHRDCVYALTPAADPNKFYSAGGDGQVVRWDVQVPDLGDLVARVESSVYALAFDPATGLLWVGQNYEGIQLIDSVGKVAVASLKIGPAAIFDIKIWRDKAFLALGDGVIAVIDILSFAVQKHLKVAAKSVRTLAIDAARGELAVGCSDHSVSIFDLDTLSLKKRVIAHKNSVFTLQYSSNGRYLVSAGRDAHLKVWDVTADLALAYDIPAHMFAINSLVFSNDGTLLATASMDKSIKIWRADTFKLLKVVDRARHAGHGTSVNRLLWLAPTNLLVSASDDRTVAVWEIE